MADELAIDTVLVHPLAGVLSAYGMGLASEAAVRERTLAEPLAGGLAAAADLAKELGAQVLSELGGNAVEVRTSLFLRREGSENTIELPPGKADELTKAFAAAHRAQFGYDGDGALVIDRVRVEATAAGETSGELDWPLPDLTLSLIHI